MRIDIFEDEIDQQPRQQSSMQDWVQEKVKIAKLSRSVFDIWQKKQKEMERAGERVSTDSFNEWLDDFFGGREIPKYTEHDVTGTKPKRFITKVVKAALAAKPKKGSTKGPDITSYLKQMSAPQLSKLLKMVEGVNQNNKTIIERGPMPQRNGMPDLYALARIINQSPNKPAIIQQIKQILANQNQQNNPQNSYARNKIQSIKGKYGLQAKRKPVSKESVDPFESLFDSELQRLDEEAQYPSFCTLTESQLLIEATKKNTHMEHLEDLVFNNGYEGAKEALAYIEQVKNMLADGTGTTGAITTKWDGAPAIICGIDPEDGKFFVGTKAVFSKEPKLAKSAATLKKFYGDNPGLYEILTLALRHLPKLGISGVLQGDFMFDQASLERAVIDGERMITFTPNTITYAAKADSDIGREIARAKIGIVFHTRYTGDTLADMTAEFGISVAGLNQTKDVWFDDAVYKDLTGIASLKPDELAKINKGIAQAEATMNKLRPEKFDVVIKDREFARLVKPFINQMIRGGKLVGNPLAFLKDFLDFYKEKMNNEIEKIKAEKGENNVGVKNRLKKIKKKEEFIEDNSNALLGVLAVYKKLAELKGMLMAKLQQVEGLGTFVKNGDGYDVTTPEGFVVIGHDGSAVKLVDRIEFTQRNFNSSQKWRKK